jgi:hypothetical protein
MEELLLFCSEYNILAMMGTLPINTKIDKKIKK